MIQIFLALKRAWSAGQQIRNPAVWKSGAEVSAYATVIVESIFTIVLFFFPELADLLSPKMTALGGTLITTALAIVSIVVGRTTTKKEVGLDVLLQGPAPPGPGQRKDDYGPQIIPSLKNIPTPRNLGQVGRGNSAQGKDVL